MFLVRKLKSISSVYPINISFRMDYLKSWIFFETNRYNNLINSKFGKNKFYSNKNNSNEYMVFI